MAERHKAFSKPHFCAILLTLSVVFATTSSSQTVEHPIQIPHSPLAGTLMRGHPDVHW